MVDSGFKKPFKICFLQKSDLHMCLNNCDKIRKSTNWKNQITFFLLISNCNSCDRATLMVIDIKRDNIFLDKIIPKITNCYFRFYLPEKFKNWKLEIKSAFYFKFNISKNIKGLF